MAKYSYTWTTSTSTATNWYQTVKPKDYTKGEFSSWTDLKTGLTNFFTQVMSKGLGEGGTAAERLTSRLIECFNVDVHIIELLMPDESVLTYGLDITKGLYFYAYTLADTKEK